MPGSVVVIKHLVDLSIPSDYIMGTHGSPGKGEGAKGLVNRMLRSVVNDHVIGLAQVEIGGSYPNWSIMKAVITSMARRKLPQFFAVLFGLLPVIPIRLGIGMTRTGPQQYQGDDDNQYI